MRAELLRPACPAQVWRACLSSVHLTARGFPTPPADRIASHPFSCVPRTPDVLQMLLGSSQKTPREFESPRASWEGSNPEVI